MKHSRLAGTVLVAIGLVLLAGSLMPRVCALDTPAAPVSTCEWPDPFFFLAIGLLGILLIAAGTLLILGDSRDRRLALP